MFAVIRASEVNLPLFLHVLGALLFVGALFTVALASLLAWRQSTDTVRLARFAFKTVLLGVFPSFLLMRLAGQWVVSKEGLEEAEVAWLDIGYMTGDPGALLVIVSMILSGLGLRKLRADGAMVSTKAIGIISILLIVASLVALWAMTTKPI